MPTDIKVSYHYTDNMFTIVGEGDLTTVSVPDMLENIAQQIRNTNEETTRPEERSEQTTDGSDTSCGAV